MVAVTVHRWGSDIPVGGSVFPCANGRRFSRNDIAAGPSLFHHINNHPNRTNSASLAPLPSFPNFSITILVMSFSLALNASAHPVPNN